MLKGSEHRKAAYAIDPLFIDRWSPRAMTGDALDEATLMTLFEAARWAPSASNVQPWRILYARRDTPAWPRFFELLAEGNRRWADRAAALVLFIAETRTAEGKPVPTHAYDSGAAWQNFALQGARMGLVVHGMAGFDYTQARSVLQVPEHYAVLAMAAVGVSAPIDTLPEALRAREAPSDRRPLAGTVCEGPFAFQR